MNRNLTYINDILGSKYLAITLDKTVDTILSDFLESFKSIAGEDKFNIFVANQELRDLRPDDNHTHHITVVNVMELPKVNTLLLAELITEPIDDLNMIGIGTAVDDKSNNEAFFIVCASDKCNAIRELLGLKQRDLHITIGFNEKDVFNHSKGIDSLIR